MSGANVIVHAELGRMDVIIDQFDYLMRRVAHMQSETEIKNYLDAVREKHIKTFEFYGVPMGTKKARYELIVHVDWGMHAKLLSTDPFIIIDEDYGDGAYKNANPDIISVAQKFLKRVKNENLEIKWIFRYSSYVNEEALNKKLGSHTVTDDERIAPPDHRNYTKYRVYNLEEMEVVHTPGM